MNHLTTSTTLTLPLKKVMVNLRSSFINYDELDIPRFKVNTQQPFGSGEGYFKMFLPYMDVAAIFVM